MSVETPDDGAATFADRLQAWAGRVALCSADGETLTYAELARRADQQGRCFTGTRGLAAVAVRNDIDSLVAYVAALRARIPVLLLDADNAARQGAVFDGFRPRWIWREGDWHDSGTVGIEPHAELGVLLQTSGSTGSPKLVRLSRGNVQANALSIARYLGLTERERAAMTLPFHYSYGMSVVNSHLASGGSLFVTRESVLDQTFWTAFEGLGATSFAGVPYTFELLERIGFRDRVLPRLRCLTQAGGRLPVDLVRRYADWAAARGKQFFVMYGQTEASPRMAYLPPASLAQHPEAIGIAVPGGVFHLVDDRGRTIDAADTAGELVYDGPNVMLGYALDAKDLARGRDVTQLRTGDLACRNAAGLYYLVGRQSRFLKLFGLRISLDDIEAQLRLAGWTAAATGSDAQLTIAVVGTDCAPAIAAFIEARYDLPRHVCCILSVDALPTLPSGKPDYPAILVLAKSAGSPPPRYADVTAAYSALLRLPDVRPGDSFLGLGGDSIVFVQMSLIIERLLGHLPDNWEAMPVGTLERLRVDGASPPRSEAAEGGATQRRFVIAVGTALVLLLGAEAVLQVRSHLKTGRSVFNRVVNAETVVIDSASGLKTYRPGLQLMPRGASAPTMRINSLGLRSDELVGPPARSELRIAVLGASTVAGAYAETNETTFPGHLQRLLRAQFPGRTVNVINAGIEGYGLDDMARLIRLRLAALRPHIVLVYPGFNDSAALCRETEADEARQPLPFPALPRWVLSGNLVAKNTVALRVRSTSRQRPDAAAIDAYGQRLTDLIDAASAERMAPALVTVARAFDHAPREEQERLAASALFFNACFDLEGLLDIGRRLNAVIRQTGQRRGLPVMDLAEEMPSGQAFFVDAGHFNGAGDERAAELVARMMLGNSQLRNVIAEAFNGSPVWH